MGMRNDKKKQTRTTTARTRKDNAEDIYERPSQTPANQMSRRCTNTASRRKPDPLLGADAGALQAATDRRREWSPDHTCGAGISGDGCLKLFVVAMAAASFGALRGKPDHEW